MDRQRWKRIREVLEGAVELDTRERSEFLDRACGSDHALRAEVEAILAASESSPGFVDTPPASVQSVGNPTSLIGQNVGPYRIEDFIAAGGMGSVFRGVPADDSSGPVVAVKLIRQGAVTTEAMRRFHAERRALATLAHLNIARLIDAGVTEQGLPFIAMEYVDGQPIDAFCDEARLTLEQRLRLFCTVCSAVSYAHQKLVVHRDLKPSNILVARDGVPKLLDFGIAKLLDPQDLVDHGNETVTRYRVMTPEYAAPEQIRGAYAATSSDVYSLGVVLYELLTGHRPYHFETRTPYEMERAICEEEPVMPSSAVRGTAERISADGSSRITLTPETVSRARNEQPGRLRRRLAGDLDAIVMQALRKQPEHRYASVDTLADDIRRHLDGLPIRARKATAGYRFSRFVRRHKASVGAATVTITSLLGGLIVALWQGQVAVRAQHAAETEARRATSINGFLQDMLADIDPLADDSDEATVRQLLDDASRKLASGVLDDQPEAKSAVHVTLGRTYLELDMYDAADGQLNQALNIREGHFGREHVGVAECLDGLGLLAKSRGSYTEADALYREALKIRRKLLGHDHIDVAESLNNLGVLMKVQGRLDDAESMLREALEIRRSALGPQHEDVATTSSNLAAVLKHLGRLDEAESLYRDAVTTYRQALGPEHLRVAVCMNNLALLLRERGRLDEAEALLLDALDIRRHVFGNEHPAVATGLHNLALVYHLDGRPEKAETMYTEALQIRRRSLGPDHPSVANTANNLAQLLISAGRPVEAEPLAREALEIRRAALPALHPRIAGSLLALGTSVLDQADSVRAEPLLREALAISSARLPRDHRQVMDAQTQLGACLVSLEQLDEAETILLEAYSHLGAPGPKTDESSRQASKLVDTLVRLYEAKGDPDEAARYANQFPRADHSE